MVSIEEVADKPEIVPASTERRLDAEAIESVASKVTRPTARMHLEALAKKLRKESEALKRVEQSRAKADATKAAVGGGDTTAKDDKEKEEKPIVEEVERKAPPVVEETKTVDVPPKPAKIAAPATFVHTGVKYNPIDRFMFDAGSYNSPMVTVYVPFPKGVTVTKDMVSCSFNASSFDLVINNPDGKAYRLFKDNLSHDIDPDKSKFKVKSEQILVKLAKVKGEYGFESWTDLVDKKKSRATDAAGKRKKDDPSASIMNLMKDMYDSGDDKMRKMIGETMEKQRRGELGGSGMGDMGGMGGMGDMGF